MRVGTGRPFSPESRRRPAGVLEAGKGMDVRQADARAVTAAETLRQAIDADCVILFGSRARADWNERSDVDLMVINGDLPDYEAMSQIKSKARDIVKEVFQKRIDVDVVFFDREEYERKSRHTINNVAAYARREGIFVSRDAEGIDSNHGAGPEGSDGRDDNEEHGERELRIADANEHYSNMHDLLDLGREGRVTAYLAQQALEHAMKGLLSAMGLEYAHSHSTQALAQDIRRNDPQGEWGFQSDLERLDNFAGGTRYGPTLTPVPDYTAMANGVTHDLEIIYERIAALTGSNPWDVPPEGTSQVVSPRWR